MTSPIRASALSVAIALMLAAAAANAQNITTSGINGRVLDAGGKPVAGATVTIVHTPSGTTKQIITDAEGRYSAAGLRVGGPFEVRAEQGGTQLAERDDVYLQLGQPASLTLAAAGAKTLETVQVTGLASSGLFATDNKGLSTTVSQQQLQATPQGNRSIDDVVRLDPRVTVLDQGGGSFSAAGQNNRYNNIAVDGVTQGDPFGLNANGLPYLKTPISPEAIAEYNISTANYDVVVDTVGADVNAVTKSGTNDFHGALYYAYRNADKLVGKAGWLPSDHRSYKYRNYKQDWTGGFNLGGPILKDKLFFFVSAEHEKMSGLGADSANGLDPSLGSGASTSGKISPGDLQKVIDIAKQLGLMPGEFGGALGLTFDDKRYLAKLDWNISDNHRASFTFQQTKNLQPAVGGNSTNSVGLSSYTYTKAIQTDNYVVHLFDDWSDSFSTELKAGYQEFVQDTTAPWDQPSVQVNLKADGTGPNVFLGKERFRHYNHIDTKKTSIFLAGTWYLGDHTIKGGIDYQRNKINNLFGQGQFGVYLFRGLANFSQGLYNSYEILQPAPGYTLPDIAGQWTYSQLSPFIQDTWQVTPEFSLQYGLRVVIPDSDKAPVHNPTFETTFGFPNNASVDASNKVFEPRVSFNYDLSSDRKTQLRGGFGLFQSSPPAVWLTNPYQNNGVTLLTYTSTNPALAPFSPDPLDQNLPPPTFRAPAVDAVDEDFKLPTVWKFSLGFDHELPWWGLVGSAEFQHIKVKDGILYEAINFGAPTGTLPDGRQQFWKTPGQVPVTADQRWNRNRAFDASSTLLTNTHKGMSDTFTLSLAKPFAEGLSGNVSLTFSRATDVDPGIDTIAFNGYQRVARLNPNDDLAGTSNFEIPVAFKTSLIWQHAFFGDYKSTISAFYSGRSGNNYTWVFGNDANGDGISGFDRVYIPTANDPNVAFTAGTTATQIQQFNDFLASDDYLKDRRGQIAERNGAKNAWINQLDLGISQEVPGFWGRGEIRLDIFNFLNMLNKNWGDTQVVSTSGYPTRTLANYAGVNAQGQYVYALPKDASGNYQPQQKVYYDGGFLDPSRTVSRWSMMVTLKYSF